MTELEMKLSNLRKGLLDNIIVDLQILKSDPRIKEIEKKIVYQTGYGKTEYYHYSVNVPPIISSNDNGNKTNT